jgi:hypothetical protein
MGRTCAEVGRTLSAAPPPTPKRSSFCRPFCPLVLVPPSRASATTARCSMRMQQSEKGCAAHRPIGKAACTCRRPASSCSSLPCPSLQRLVSSRAQASREFVAQRGQNESENDAAQGVGMVCASALHGGWRCHCLLSSMRMCVAGGFVRAPAASSGRPLAQTQQER